ncbi:NUDIX hydrolase, partial [Candidatus Woesearchaeota archaeon]|nr:NUDIX hydrolase [Candidatus Woesearchaeota archaeon]
MQEDTYYDQQGNPVIKPAGIKSKKRNSCYVAIVYEKKILCVRTRWNPSLWCLPGGMVEDNEELKEGIKREILEETGYNSEIEENPIYESFSRFYAKDVKIFFDSRIRIFLSRKFKKEKQYSDEEEILEVSWEKVDDLTESN